MSSSSWGSMMIYSGTTPVSSSTILRRSKVQARILAEWSELAGMHAPGPCHDASGQDTSSAVDAEPEVQRDGAGG